MSIRERAIEIAKRCARAHLGQHDYLREVGEDWQPHPWVVSSIEQALAMQPRDAIAHAIDLAVEAYGDHGDGLFNSACFSSVAARIANHGPIDGKLVQWMLAGRSDVAPQDNTSYFKRIPGDGGEPSRADVITKANAQERANRRFEEALETFAEAAFWLFDTEVKRGRVVDDKTLATVSDRDAFKGWIRSAARVAARTKTEHSDPIVAFLQATEAMHARIHGKPAPEFAAPSRDMLAALDAPAGQRALLDVLRRNRSTFAEAIDTLHAARRDRHEDALSPLGDGVSVPSWVLHAMDAMTYRARHAEEHLGKEREKYNQAVAEQRKIADEAEARAEKAIANDMATRNDLNAQLAELRTKLDYAVGRGDKAEAEAAVLRDQLSSSYATAVRGDEIGILRERNGSQEIILGTSWVRMGRALEPILGGENVQLQPSTGNVKAYRDGKRAKEGHDYLTLFRIQDLWWLHRGPLETAPRGELEKVADQVIVLGGPHGGVEIWKDRARGRYEPATVDGDNFESLFAGLLARRFVPTAPAEQRAPSQLPKLHPVDLITAVSAAHRSISKARVEGRADGSCTFHITLEADIEEKMGAEAVERAKRVIEARILPGIRWALDYTVEA